MFAFIYSFLHPHPVCICHYIKGTKWVTKQIIITLTYSDASNQTKSVHGFAVDEVSHRDQVLST